ncbi:MAG: outer membrane lipoprotein-sorting protein [Deltaproteobacteria bacterium]|nr:MAG: outer membrane lipoprotein-sorting protein [Deltaproteobacteria bacterium]
MIVPFLVLALGMASEPEPTVEELLRGTDDLTRGSQSTGRAEMHVKTRRYERTVVMDMWSKGTDRTLVRIVSPARDAGITTLKVEDNLWNYLPRTDRTVRVPAGMMSGSWMGSHVTNDDLVNDSRLSEDYTYTVKERPEGDDGRWVIELSPTESAAVVWGKVVATLGADRLPREIRYYDGRDALVRTMTWSDVKDFGDRRIPSRFRVQPADQPEEFTEFRYLKLDFETPVPDRTFSLQSLKR